MRADASAGAVDALEARFGCLEAHVTATTGAVQRLAASLGQKVEASLAQVAAHERVVVETYNDLTEKMRRVDASLVCLKTEIGTIVVDCVAKFATSIEKKIMKNVTKLGVVAGSSELAFDAGPGPAGDDEVDVPDASQAVNSGVGPNIAEEKKILKKVTKLDIVATSCELAFDAGTGPVPIIDGSTPQLA